MARLISVLFWFLIGSFVAAFVAAFVEDLVLAEDAVPAMRRHPRRSRPPSCCVEMWNVRAAMDACAKLRASSSLPPDAPGNAVVKVVRVSVICWKPVCSGRLLSPRFW